MRLREAAYISSNRRQLSRGSTSVLSLGLLLAVQSYGQTRSTQITVPLTGSNGMVGEVIIRQTMRGGLNFDIKVQSLTRGKHALHIHQNAVCETPDFRSAGAHFNPEAKQHGWLNPVGHHAGDMPENIVVDADGYGSMNVTLYGVSLTPGAANSVLGRSLVVHEKEDDMSSEPSGNSGNRIACGVIGVTK